MSNTRILWEKWRPKTMDDIILLPRIRSNFKDGIKKSYIFHGSYGTGKTSLARILIGKYSNGKPHLEINSSLYTSIDVLRNEIEDFCKFKPIFSGENDDEDSDIKYILLDEFDRVSVQFQDAFKAFIEKYNKNVVFIITTNHINKISNGIKSRMTLIDFDCKKDLVEAKYIKTELYKRIKNLLLKEENIKIEKNNLVSIIQNNFPDLRRIISSVQDFIDSGNLAYSSKNNSESFDLPLYQVIYDSSISYEQVYNFLIENYGPEGIKDMITSLGNPFINWSITNNKNVEKLFQCSYVIADYSSKIETNTDPIILGMTIIGKFKDILTRNG
jgi:DNA polymerase III delta prime subunit